MTLTTNAKLMLTVAAVLGGGCQEGGVADPTWVDDVRPIMAGNCVRCHGLPAIGGAPDSFRLDKYDDTVLPDGTVIRGAFTMGEYIVHRAGVLGEMPPDYPRGDGQRETLENWFDPGAGKFFNRGEQAGNREPDIELLSALPAGADDEAVALDYEITDADGDLVDGALIVVPNDGAEVIVDAGFRSGRGTVQWNPTTFPEGEYDVFARLTDDTVEVDVQLGQITVDHGANALPAVSFVAPVRDTLIGPPQSPFTIIIDVTDPDSIDVVTASFIAVRGDEEVAIATDVPVVLGQATATWDTSALDDAPTWRVRAIVSDGLGETVVESGRVIVSNEPTDLAFDDVLQNFGVNCAPCHPGRGINGITHNFALHQSNDIEAGVEELRGLIYRRVVLERTMPPPSAPSILDQDAMSEGDRAEMAEYLLGGAP